MGKIGIEPFQFIILLILLAWILLTALAISDLAIRSKKLSSEKPNDKIALVFAAIMFGCLFGYTSKNRLDRNNFCVMNYNDSLCDSIETDCFDKNDDSLISFDFNLGKFIKTNSSSGI